MTARDQLLIPWHWSRDTVRDFISDSAMSQAAAIAFYALLSLAPLLVMVIAIAGAVWGAEAARGEIVSQFSHLMGQDAAKAIEEIIQRASEQKSSGTLATIIGLALLVSGAIGVFGQIKSALNRVWEVELRPGRGLWGLVRDHLLSFAMVLCIAFVLLVSLAVNAALSALGGWIGNMVQVPPGLMWLVNAVLSLGFITLLFAAMYKILPDVRVAWRDVWIGAFATSILFALGKFLIGFYLGRSTTVSVYGAAGSVVLVLLWVYYSTVIFLLGAEFTQVYARWSGSPIEPAAHAQMINGHCETPEHQPARTPRKRTRRSAGRSRVRTR